MRTADIVYQAICSGFKGIDTAAQSQHDREDLVGDGIRRALSDRQISRDELFIQANFTSVEGQDPSKIPYDPTASISENVHTSIRSSLENLRPLAESSSSESTYLDCLMLDSPPRPMAQTLEAWRAAEAYVPHKIRSLGLSKVPLATLEPLHDAAEIKPAMVQHCFYPTTHPDFGVRAFCAKNSIIFQSIETLKGHPKFFGLPEVRQMAGRMKLVRVEAVYGLVLALDNVMILNDTSSGNRMVKELSCVQRTREWALNHPKDWPIYLDRFKMLLGESSKSKDS